MKKLSESFIDDVIYRSRNMEDREEDSVDRLNCEEMVDYIKSHYDVKSRYVISFMRNSDNAETMSINMDSFGDFWISVKYYNDKPKYLKIGPMAYIKRYIPEIQNELKKHFEIQITDFDTAIEITSEVSNKKLRELIDIAIDFNNPKDAVIKKKKLSESFIDDVIRRSRNMEEREEDSVDRLGMKDMYNYITEHYEFIEHPNAWPMCSYNDNEEFMIPLFYSDNNPNIPVHLKATYAGGILNKLVLQSDSSDCADIMGILNKKFYLTSLGYQGMKIRSKQGDVSNKLCLEFIDTVIENIKNPLMKKNEEVK